MNVSIVTDDLSFIELVKKNTVYYTIIPLYGPFYRVEAIPNGDLNVETLLTNDISPEIVTLSNIEENFLLEDSEMIKKIQSTIYYFYKKEYGSIIDHVALEQTDNNLNFIPVVKIPSISLTVDTSYQEIDGYDQWEQKYRGYLYSDGMYPLYYHSIRNIIFTNYNWTVLKDYTLLIDRKYDDSIFLSPLIKFAILDLNLKTLTVEGLSFIHKETLGLETIQQQIYNKVSYWVQQGSYSITSNSIIEDVLTTFSIPFVRYGDELLVTPPLGMMNKEWLHSTYVGIEHNELPLIPYMIDKNQHPAEIMWSVFNLLKHSSILRHFKKFTLVGSVLYIPTPHPIELNIHNKKLYVMEAQSSIDAIIKRLYLSIEDPNNLYMVIPIKGSYYIVSEKEMPLPELNVYNVVSQRLGYPKTDKLSDIPVMRDYSLAALYGFVDLNEIKGLIPYFHDYQELKGDRITLSYVNDNIWNVYLLDEKEEPHLVDKIESLGTDEHVYENALRKLRQGNYTVDWYNVNLTLPLRSNYIKSIE